MGNCGPANYNRDPIHFYKNVNISETDQNSAKEKVKLTISLHNVQDQNLKWISLLIYSSKARMNHRVGGQTEKQSRNAQNDINFTQFFIMEYYFEKEQPMGINILSTSNILVQTTLGSIMGSRGQKFTKKLDDGSTLEINGKNLNNNNMKAHFDITVNGNLKNTGLTFLIRYLGVQNNPQNNPIFRSEIKEGIDLINFQRATIPAMYLAPDGKYENNILAIEINDCYHEKKLGEFVGPMTNLLSKNVPIPLIKNGNATVNMKLEKEYSFLDYLKGGMEINLIIGIDFTSSNLDPKLPNSLHNITSNVKNSYEKAIKSCGDIVGYYDYDQLFPVYGYGAILPNDTVVSHCFPINGNPQDPNINTIDGVLETYRQILPMLKLHGPTYFAPIINELNKNVKEDLAAGNTMNYSILMILTDGLINDMDDTIDALVEASFLPISVIIIGIGNGDFGNMDILDADEEPLFDRGGRKADRDLVQFVPFSQYANDGEKLAEQVLEEVPRQVVEYYQHNKIYPADPVLNIA